MKRLKATPRSKSKPESTGDELRIEISLAVQTLKLLAGKSVILSCPVSTARNGPGEKMNSGCTPRGRHVVAEKIGDGCAPNTVFIGRRPTGEIYTPELRHLHPGRDWILTRILWLAGVEAGINQGGEVDSHGRYIYIHGTPDDVTLGVPRSAGCIRMRNKDVIELFGHVSVGTAVNIREQELSKSLRQQRKSTKRR